MTVFDAHCDTLQRITDFGDNLRENRFHIDLKRLKESGYNHIQVFAAFINQKKDKLSPFLRCRQLIDKYFDEIEKAHDLIKHCVNLNDTKNAFKEKKVAAFLSIEGGEALEGNIENLYYFFDRGVRCITLTWNYANEICDGIEDESGRGLTDFGKKVVSEMNSLGMLVDVSHISEKGFWDVVEYSAAPVAATHSNARSVCSHRRNLSDEQIGAIIKVGGCIGINLYPVFLSDEKCSFKTVFNHIEHILSLGGENNIGLGCDFDGVDELPEGVCGVQDLYKLFDEMQRLGYADLLIKKLLSGNFLNLIEKIHP